MTENAIHVDDLRVEYLGLDGHPVVALSGVSFSVGLGERVAIIGRSGSGKSTLLRALGGLVAPATGSVRIGEHGVKPPHQASRALYAQVGMVFQDYGLVRQLSPVQNVLCGALHRYSATGAVARFDAEDQARAASLLSALGLGDRLHVPSGKLSGGEQQRVAIARLMMQAPPILLLDEPIASLDVHWAEAALEQLRQVRGGRATTMTILHDLSMARRWATRVLLIEDGKLRFDGDPDAGCAQA